MPNSTMQPTVDLRAWALAGAREQLRLIYATFPELRPSPHAQASEALCRTAEANQCGHARRVGTA
jgi:hypothetical protein